MEQERKQFLFDLLNSMSPSGFENESVAIWKERAAQFADEVYCDIHGNTIAVYNKEAAHSVMLAGHIDEIGLMIKFIDDKGFLYFAKIGGVDLKTLYGQKVTIYSTPLNKKITGVIGKVPIHLEKTDERSKIPEIEKMWIDIGATDKEDALTKVSIGDPAVIQQHCIELTNDTISGKGIDDKCGAFIALETLIEAKKMQLPITVYAVATVQEELGLRGSRTSAFHLDPDFGFAIDVTWATCQPDINNKKVGEVFLGKGPVIPRGPNINSVLFSQIKKTAENNEIATQTVAWERAAGNDANAIQISRSGVITAVLGIPNRYMHTPCEVISLADCEAAIMLLSKTIAELTTPQDYIPY